MNRCTTRMLRRSIGQSFGRFLAILAIVALGVGFVSGLKSAQPDMLNSAEDYFRRTNYQDFRLLSSLGLTEGDAEAFRALYGVEAAEGACFSDAWASPDGGDESVWHFETLTEEVSVPELVAGRMPEGPGECLGDNRAFDEGDLGKAMTLSAQNSEDTLSHFAQRRFVITGLARSPVYISGDRGSSELGSGKPEGFVLIPQEAFADEVYHELRLRCSLEGALYSEEYSEARRRMRPSVETLLNRRGLLREEDLKRDAQEELKRGREELDRGWSEYRLGKRKAEQELEDALATLNASQAQWDEGMLEVMKGERQAKKTREETEASLAKLAEESAALTTEETQLRNELLALYGQKAAIQAEKLSYEAGQAVAVGPEATQMTVLYAQLLVLQLDPVGNAAEIAETQTQIAALQLKLDEAAEQSRADREAKEAEWAAQELALDAQMAEIEGDADTEHTLKYISARRAAIQTEQMTLQMTLSTLPAVLDELAYSRLELEDGAVELQQGWDDYYEGKKKAEQELAEALRKLEDGEKELAEGEAELRDALQLDLYVLDRGADAGYVTFENDTAIIDAIAGPFPFFFALVAALVCVTTMTRMVNEERTQIGTMKALGYSSGAVMSKYLSYVGLSSLLGSVIGFFLGSTGLPLLVWHAYNIMYQYADLKFCFSLPLLLACSAVAVAGSLLVTWRACRSALMEKPAELIRPKAPAVGKRVLLERFPAVWERLPFLSKLSIRNAFRYPSRVLMMILGISGCTALIVAGFGVRDSISRVANYQYDEIALYDLSVTLEEGADLGILEESGTVAPVRREEVTLVGAGQEKDTQLTAGDPESLPKVLDLHRKDGTDIPFPGKGEAVISRKLSEDLGLREGDGAVLRLEGQREIPVTVTGICQYYVGHGLFLSRETLPDTGVNGALIRVPEGEDPGRTAAAIRSLEGVQYVSLTRTERETIETSMQSLDLITVALVLCSGALAFITLYNLTNINLMERVREVATVKVLGFTPIETARYILDENLLLSFLGALAGLLLGKVFHRFILEMVHVEYMTFDIRIAPLSYAVSFGITMVFAFLTNLFMRGKLRHVHMAESLKSVE